MGFLVGIFVGRAVNGKTGAKVGSKVGVKLLTTWQQGHNEFTVSWSTSLHR